MNWSGRYPRRLRRRATLSGLLLILVLLASGQASSQTPAASLAIWEVQVQDNSDVQRLIDGGFDVLEARGDDYVLVLGDAAAERDLRASGWTFAVHQELPALAGPSLFTFDGGYRTVVEHYAHLDTVAAAHPELVRLIDYGDSWNKQNGQTGHDLRAICITAQQAGDCALTPQSSKPRLMIMSAIHARELSTAELTWRWIDELVTKYGTDPEITELLNYNEMWVIPLVNPDGRSVVEQGGNSPYTQRKNTHDYSVNGCSFPPSSGSQIGVDLNRNANYQWGGASTSGSACNIVFRGPTAASEPETYELQNFLGQIFPDQRADDLSALAPITTTGTFITLHSYSNLVLLPWGWTECNGQACPANLQAPNDTGLRSLAFRMSYFNQYDTGQPSELLYAAAGGTDDWTYGRLGIASYTFEVGPDDFSSCSSFFPAYTCQDSRFWPENRGAFLYAGWTARQPYALSLGPTALQVTTTITQVELGLPLTLTARLDDGRYGSNGIRRPASQPIAAAEAWIDTPPWDAGTPLALSAVDGSFSTVAENVTGTVNTTGLSVGRHTLWVRGQDSAGNWGPPTPQWFWVSAAEQTPHIFIPLITQ